MCTTIGFHYKEGHVFGRTLEITQALAHQILYVPKNTQDFFKTSEGRTYETRFSTIGTGFFDQPSFGDGINEKGLMGSNNFFPAYATFAKECSEDRINLISSEAFDFLLTRCQDVEEVKATATTINLLAQNAAGVKSMSMHFFFMDQQGATVVLEPREGSLIAHDNPYGVLTNAPDFSWHATNLKNYLHLKPENIESSHFNDVTLTKLGEGNGLVGLPGDFTPPSRFIRAAYFVAQTPKDLDRQAAIRQAFRILAQFDIPTGAVGDATNGHCDETLYTSVMDTKQKAYFIKGHNHSFIQAFQLEDYLTETDIQFIPLQQEKNL